MCSHSSANSVVGMGQHLTQPLQLPSDLLVWFLKSWPRYTRNFIIKDTSFPAGLQHHPGRSETDSGSSLSFWILFYFHKLQLSLLSGFIHNPASMARVCIDLSTDPTIGKGLIFIINILFYVTYKSGFSDKNLTSEIGDGSGSRGTES